MFCGTPLCVSRVHGFAFLHECLQPAKNFLPAYAVALGLLHIAGESFLANFDQRARADAMWTGLVQAMNVARLKLASHRGLQRVRETWVPGIYKQSWPIDFQVLAIYPEWFAICADAGA